MKIVKVFIPIKVVSPNVVEHWGLRYKRNQAQQRAVSLILRPQLTEISLPCTVTLCRIAPRAFDDDNNITAFKWIRDTIAGLLVPNLAPGQADIDSRITWAYTQKKPCSKGIVGIEISIEETKSKHSDVLDDSIFFAC